jgi:hypothetical protein
MHNIIKTLPMKEKIVQKEMATNHLTCFDKNNVHFLILVFVLKIIYLYIILTIIFS